LKKIILIIYLLMAVNYLYAQPYYFKHFQVEQGLSHNTVFCSVQDSQGFMWFGTKDGLNRFDGYSFKTYRHDPDRPGSIGNDLIYCLHYDPQSILWVGTDNGIYRYDAVQEIFSLLEGTRGMNAHSIQSDDRGNLWFIAAGRLYRYNAEKKSLYAFKNTVHFESNVLFKAKNGDMWVCTSAGTIEHYNFSSHAFKSFYVLNKNRSGSSGTVSGIEETSDGKMVIGTTTQGIKLFNVADGKVRDLITLNTDLTHIFVRDLVKVKVNEFWIGTESGIYIYNHNTGLITNLRKQFNNNYTLSDNAIYSLCRDREGGIWLSTYFGGINYYSPQYSIFTKYFPMQQTNSISGSAVREITSDGSGNIWAGTEDAGLNRLEMKTGLFKSYLPSGAFNSISYSNVHGLLVDGNWLWISTFEHGIDLLDIRTGKIFKHFRASDKNGLRSNFILSLYRTASGMVMIATTHGMYTYNRIKEHFEPVRGLPYVFYNSVMEDDEHNFWAGTFDAGVYRFRLDTRAYHNFQPKAGDTTSLSHRTVNGIFQDSRKNIWVTTDGGGLCLYDKASGAFKRYGTRDGFPSNYLFRMEEDESKKLWISSTRGLVHYDPETRNIKTYSRADGLLTDQFNYSSSFKDSTGRMYFGSVKGMISFMPEQLKTKYLTPPVYITGFQINNDESTDRKDNYPLEKSILATDTIILSNNQSTFSINFASLSFISPEMTQYAYKMQGLYKDWISVKSNRRIYFTKLSPGNYTFEVKALVNGSNNWSKKNARVFIRILPPFWLSPFAFILYILITIALISAVVLRYHRKIVRKNRRRMEIFEHEKEKEIYQAKIEFFTQVSHEIRTPLTLIKGPMEKLLREAGSMPSMERNLKIMNRNTERLMSLTNQLLDFRKTEKNNFSLNFSKSDISEMLQEITQDFLMIAEQKMISLEILLPETALQAYVDQEAFYKIVGCLIDNAMKYGENTVIVHLGISSENPDYFQIRIMSDGPRIPTYLHEKVFEPFYRIRETEIKPGTGIGLPISRSLAELHQGKLVIEKSTSPYNIFVVTLPIHQLIEFNLQEKWKKH
jgi:ligand-binding sensor domain-containing protein/signal transduction histidine kinase